MSTRAPIEPTRSQPIELRRVSRAAKARRDAERAYLDALCAARAAGRPASEIGEAAGVSRQAVLKITSDCR